MTTIPTTLSFTSKLRLAKPAVGTTDWWAYDYNRMDLVDALVPRVNVAPPRITAATAVSGGSLTAARYYYYKVVALKAANATYTLASVETIGALTDGTNKTVELTWTTVSGATTYRIYRIANGLSTPDFPINSDYLCLAEVSNYPTPYTQPYPDTGTLTPSGAMPTTTNWYVTELQQYHVVADTTEASPSVLVASGSCADLRDNIANLRYMLKSVNGQSSWLTAPSTSLYQITNGKAGGQSFTGGTLTTQSLTLISNSSGTPDGYINLQSKVNLLGYALYGSDQGAANFAIYASSHGTNTGYLDIQNNVMLNGKILYGNVGSGGNLALDSTIHATKGAITLGATGTGGTIVIGRTTTPSTTVSMDGIAINIGTGYTGTITIGTNNASNAVNVYGPVTITKASTAAPLAIVTSSSVAPISLTGTGKDTMVAYLTAQYLGATSHDSAWHINRANHTGTQLIATISDHNATAHNLMIGSGQLTTRSVTEIKLDALYALPTFRTDASTNSGLNYVYNNVLTVGLTNANPVRIIVIGSAMCSLNGQDYGYLALELTYSAGGSTGTAYKSQIWQYANYGYNGQITVVGWFDVPAWVSGDAHLLHLQATTSNTVNAMSVAYRQLNYFVIGTTAP